MVSVLASLDGAWALLFLWGIIDFSTAGVRMTLIDTDEIAYSDDDDAIGDSPSFINRRNLMALWSRVDTVT